MPHTQNIETMLEYQRAKWKTEEHTVGKLFDDVESLKKILDIPKINVNSGRGYDIYVATIPLFGHIYVGYSCNYCNKNIVGIPNFKISQYQDSERVKKVMHECTKCHKELYHKIYAKQH
ncbi:MAG: hypothetical protein AABW88_04545 [Nanoarchaeota archaeon]